MKRLVQNAALLQGLILIAGCMSPESEVIAPDDRVPAYARPVPAGDAIAIVQLPAIGTSAAYAINDAEEIAGSTASSPARWIKSGNGWTLQRLTMSVGRANDINEAGTVVGSSNGTITLWRRDGTSEEVGTGYPVALNEAEIVVGVRAGPNAGTAWVKEGSTWVAHSLPRLPGITTGINEPSSINNDGVIVGYSFDATGTQHAVKWVPSLTSPGEWDAAAPIDAFAGSSNSAAIDIEGSHVGGVVWRCTVPFDPTTCRTRDAYHWTLEGSPGTGSLGVEDGWVEGLNASRFMVGPMFVPSKGSSVARGYVWSPGAPVLRDIGLSKGYRSAWPQDINNSTATRATKQIVGYLQSNGGSQAAVVWILQ